MSRTGSSLVFGIAFSMALLAGGPATWARASSTEEGMSPEDGFAGLSFLLGDWEGKGGGGPGQGSGTFFFSSDLQHKVLVRRNHAEYPAAPGRAAVSHDDLMVVYRQAGEKGPLAIYFDSEGHVIRYRVRHEKGSAAERQAVIFISDAEPGTPRYRLTYEMKGPDALELKLEIAPPDKPDAFAVHITASARRQPVL